MKSGKTEGSLHLQDKLLSFRLGILSYEDDGFKVLYCPELRIYGYGDTEKEAKEDFACVMKTTLEYMVKKKTLDRVLKNYGWVVKKKNKEYFPPNPMNLVEHDKNFKKELLDSDSLKWKTELIQIPIA